MKEIESEPGMHINEAAKRLADAAQSEDCFLIFNDICLAATRTSTAQSLAAEYDRLSELRRAEYEASPKGIADRRRDEQQRNELQTKADFLLAELPHLDFTDLEICMRWLCDIEAARDRRGVNVDGKRIQDVFRSHGFEPNAYTGEQFVKGDPDIEARWLIGQAIADVYVPMVRHFYGQIVRV